MIQYVRMLHHQYFPFPSAHALEMHDQIEHHTYVRNLQNVPCCGNLLRNYLASYSVSTY